jgi:hypothetical protein
MAAGLTDSLAKQQLSAKRGLVALRVAHCRRPSRAALLGEEAKYDQCGKLAVSDRVAVFLARHAKQYGRVLMTEIAISDSRH